MFDALTFAFQACLFVTVVRRYIYGRSDASVSLLKSTHIKFCRTLKEKRSTLNELILKSTNRLKV